VNNLNDLSRNQIFNLKKLETNLLKYDLERERESNLESSISETKKRKKCDNRKMKKTRWD